MDQVVTFEFVEDFDFSKLEKCATNEQIFIRVFVCRQGDCWFQCKLLVVPKDKRGEKETLGLYLKIVDCPGVLFADIYPFAGNKVICISARNVKFEPEKCVWGTRDFLPTVASLKERGLVVDGVVKLGVKIVLKASIFDPFRWLPTPSLTPDKNLIVRHLFANLGTDDHHGTDFIIIVGEGNTTKELHVNRLALRRVPSLDWVFNIESKKNRNDVLHLRTHTTDAVIEVLRYLYLNEVGVDLTQFLPSLLLLASEWELKPLLTEIERAMMVKLQTDRSNFDLAFDYLELTTSFDTKYVHRLALCIVMYNWAKFLASPNDKRMKDQLKRVVRVTLVMAAAAVYKGVFTGMDPDPLRSVPASRLTPYASPVVRQLFAKLGTDDHYGTDFIITVGEGEAEKDLHVCRLALRVVPFFDRMFDNNTWKENQEGVLSLPMHTVDVVIEVLRFVYLNEVGEDLTRFLPSILSLNGRLNGKWMRTGV